MLDMTFNLLKKNCEFSQILVLQGNRTMSLNLEEAISESKTGNIDFIQYRKDIFRRHQTKNNSGYSNIV